MKTIGLLGGMSWESTLSYYKLINEGVKEALGGLNSAKICMYSVNFSEIEKLQHQGKWEETASILSDAASSIEKGGADFILICTNTMHKVAPQIEASINIPILHIADATAELLREKGFKRSDSLVLNSQWSKTFIKEGFPTVMGLMSSFPIKTTALKYITLFIKSYAKVKSKRSQGRYTCKLLKN